MAVEISPGVLSTMARFPDQSPIPLAAILFLKL
jgi:hypothetical protein